MTAKPVIVLVRPQLGKNIGKAARAMLNFGLTELRTDEDNNRLGRAHSNLSWPGGGVASFSTRSAISAKSPGSLKSLYMLAKRM